MPRSNSVRKSVRDSHAAGRGLKSLKRAFIRRAMPFLRNEKGFRYELDTDKNNPTYNQPKRVARKHAQVVL